MESGQWSILVSMKVTVRLPRDDAAAVLDCLQGPFPGLGVVPGDALFAHFRAEDLLRTEGLDHLGQGPGVVGLGVVDHEVVDLCRCH
jgi:hypothetical protein